MPDPIRLLCTADLHLGRFPARVPVGRPELSVERVWDDIVEHAIHQQVDAVLLLGDVVDEANRFFEAFGPLKRGVERLVSAGITTFAVVGNHDHEVLPPLADALESDHFRLLGRGGVWEAVDFAPEGKVAVRLVGWSFPTRHFMQSPIQGFPALEDGPATLAMLHADLGVPGSRYAPVNLNELLAQPVDAWLLGHQHGRVHTVHGGHHVLYPGSPQPLRPPETGSRGPTILTIDHSGEISADLVPLATVRYDELSTDVSGAGNLSEAHEIISRDITETLRSLEDEQPTLRHVALRLALTGRTKLHREISGAASDIEKKLSIPEGRVQASVERVLVSTRPQRELSANVNDSGPSGVLARLLVDLQSDGEMADPLLGDATRMVAGLLQKRAYLPLHREGHEAPAQDQIREVMNEQGLLLLDELVTQSEGSQ